jgi:hypothetical protein
MTMPVQCPLAEGSSFPRRDERRPGGRQSPSTRPFRLSLKSDAPPVATEVSTGCSAGAELVGVT